VTTPAIAHSPVHLLTYGLLSTQDALNASEVEICTGERGDRRPAGSSLQVRQFGSDPSSTRNPESEGVAVREGVRRRVARREKAVGATKGEEAFDLIADDGRFSAHGTPSGSFAPIDRGTARSRGVAVTTIADLQYGEGDLRPALACGLGRGRVRAARAAGGAKRFRWPKPRRLVWASRLAKPWRRHSSSTRSPSGLRSRRAARSNCHLLTRLEGWVRRRSW
jgi:hypothetical protein